MDKPVAVYILGVKLYFVFDPAHVMATFRNATTLSWDKFLDELLVLFGVDRAAINGILHRHNPHLKELYTRVTSRPVKAMSLRHFTEALYMRQLSLDKADDLSVAFFKYLLETTRTETLSSMGSGLSTIRTPLRDLVDRTVSRSIARMLFGDKIFELEEDFTKHTVVLADDLWRIVYRYPRWLARSFYNSYEHVMVAIERFSLLGPEDLSSASFMMRTMLEAEELYDLDTRSAACLLCIMYIA
ncbi:hypothetical protein SLS60_005734 [Paraconiothyrium brasiliense]|uniref:Uncharacterized protein n=1 Tax=Paraconiothyrium brasiliense TaxID=300254 RepID=A0ABR3RI74_9PLEO